MFRKTGIGFFWRQSPAVFHPAPAADRLPLHIQSSIQRDQIGMMIIEFPDISKSRHRVRPGLQTFSRQ